MDQNVRYYWMQELGNHLCLCHIICIVSHFICYQTQRIQVGNGQYVNFLFIIPAIVDIHQHRFEIYTLVSEMHDDIDLALGIKSIFELEGVINSLDCCFDS